MRNEGTEPLQLRLEDARFIGPDGVEHELYAVDVRNRGKPSSVVTVYDSVLVEDSGFKRGRTHFQRQDLVGKIPDLYDLRSYYYYIESLNF